MIFPELITPHYRLRQILSQDLQFIFQGLSHPEVIRHYGVRYETLEATNAQMDWYESLWKERTGIWWIITNEQDMPMGACGFNYFNLAHEKIELGFWLLPQFQGNGVMKEILPVIIAYIFTNWQVHRIEALVESGNNSSCGLLERVGFTREGMMKECEIKNGTRISLVMYSLLKGKDQG